MLTNMRPRALTPFSSIDIWKLGGQFARPFAHHQSHIIQPHFSIDDFPEQALPVQEANGAELGPCLGIIVFLQSNGPAVVNGGIVCRAVGANLRVRPIPRRPIPHRPIPLGVRTVMILGKPVCLSIMITINTIRADTQVRPYGATMK